MIIAQNTMNGRSIAAVIGVSRSAPRFTEFVGTYHSLMKRVSEEERLAASHPTLLWTAPHLEVRASAFALDAFALDAVLPRPRWQDDGYEERSYDLDGEASLEELLFELGPDFARTWRGATQSLRSRNAAERVHTSIADAPKGRAIETKPLRSAQITRLPRVGGLHGRYAWRVAA